MIDLENDTMNSVDNSDTDEQQSSDVGNESGYSSDTEAIAGLTTPTDSSTGENEETVDDAATSELPLPEERITTALMESNLIPPRQLNSVGSDRRSTSDEDTSDDSHWNVAYLSKKRHVLKRAVDYAKQEEEYNASIALALATAPLGDTPLWREAKEILQVLCAGQTSGNRPHTPRAGRSGQSLRNTKRPRIDLSAVQHFSSKAVDSDTFHPKCSWNASHEKVSFPKTLYSNENWMVKALARVWNVQSIQQGEASPAGRHTNAGGLWDTLLGPQAAGISSMQHKLSSKNALQLEDAIACTPVAQLIAQSVPPFVVVHANRAFAVFSGIVSEDIIGRPIEYIVHVLDHISPDKQLSQECLLDAVLKAPFPSRRDKKQDIGETCRIRVMPVLEGSQGKASPTSATEPKLVLHMSHVLVQFYQANVKRDEDSTWRRVDVTAHAAQTSPEERTGTAPSPTGVVGAVG